MGPADFDLASVDLVLRTTRSVRRKLDYSRPVAPELIEECIEIATQAPTGRNAQAWRFLVVTEPEAKRWLGELYRRAFEHYAAPRQAEPDAEPIKATHRLLADRLHEMPALILVCIEGRPEPLSVAQQVLRIPERTLDSPQNDEYCGVALRVRPASYQRGSSLQRVESAQAIIWKILRVAEQAWRKLNAPALLPLVASGVPCKDGRMIRSGRVTGNGNDQAERTDA